MSADPGDVLREVLAERLDVGVAAASGLEQVERLVVEMLPRQRIYFACRPGHPLTQESSPSLARALERGIPILAICKGVQVLNLALGGGLHLHIEGHNLPELRDGNLQALRFSSTARHRFERVNSSHHQALAELGAGLEVEAWCAEDNVIEQVRLRNAPFCVGVQYHPERDLLYGPLFEEFLSALRG